MIVQIRTKEGRDIPIEESGFVPPPVGRLFEVLLKRKNYSYTHVEQVTGIRTSILEGLVAGKERFSIDICNKLQKLIPHSKRTLLEMQKHTDFYNKFGVMRPGSYIKRRQIRRKSYAPQPAKG